MKRLIVAQFLILSFNIAAFSQNSSGDVFTPIGKYLQQGDLDSLAAWFDSNLELEILGNINECSKNQAKQIMKSFFSEYTPKSFKVVHKSGTTPMKYVVGNLDAGGEVFRVTIFVKTQEKGNFIQQLKIEKKK